MRRLVFAILAFLIGTQIFAQVPYFAGTVGSNKLYGYTSLKFRPGINAQETYTTFQYGIGSSFATGLDLYTGPGSAYMGVLVRYGAKISPYFNIGAQATPSLDLNNSMSFDYATVALYMNGNITNDGKLFWCSNTWWGINRRSANTYSQWTFLGYSFSFKNGHGITPMIGEIHSWKFDQPLDMAVGFYYSIRNWNFYLWGNDFFSKNPRLVLGVDFAI